MLKIQIVENKEISLDVILSALKLTKEKCLNPPKNSDKASKIKKLLKISGAANTWYEIISEIIDEKISFSISEFENFEKFTPIVPLKNDNGHSYGINTIIFYTGNQSSFYKGNGNPGNAMSVSEGSWRFATEEEVMKLYE